jgi:hypothetical protein
MADIIEAPILWFLIGMAVGWIICWIRNKTKPKEEPEIIDVRGILSPKFKPKRIRIRKKKVQSAQEIIDEVVKNDNERETLAKKYEENQQVLVD